MLHSKSFLFKTPQILTPLSLKRMGNFADNDIYRTIVLFPGKRWSGVHLPLSISRCLWNGSMFPFWRGYIDLPSKALSLIFRIFGFHFVTVEFLCLWMSSTILFGNDNLLTFADKRLRALCAKIRSCLGYLCVGKKCGCSWNCPFFSECKNRLLWPTFAVNTCSPN